MAEAQPVRALVDADQAGTFGGAQVVGAEVAGAEVVVVVRRPKQVEVATAVQTRERQQFPGALRQRDDSAHVERLQPPA